MNDTPDAELLRQFARDQSEAAFVELVRRHIGLVYSVAFRKTGNSQQAEDVTQAVFIILARKADSLGAKTVVPGWLYHTTRLTAANAQRAEMRRIHHEQEAFMQSTNEEPAPDPLWPELAPLLEDAMAGLGASDRDALVLRYFKSLSLADVGATMGVTEGVAQRRVSRALEKLRRLFAKRGVHSTTAIIAGVISSNSLLQAVPPALAESVTAAALMKGAAASTSTLTLAHGALKVMAWSKAKTAVVIGLALVLALGTTTVAVKLMFFPAIQDSYFLANYRHFQRLPSGLFTLRLTHFDVPVGGLDYSCETGSPSGEHVTWMMGRNRSFVQFVSRLYNCAMYQVVLPPAAPTNHFDYLFTVRDGSAGERFEAALRRLGYAAHWEDRDTEVALLKVKIQNSPGLRPDVLQKRPAMKWAAQDRLEFRNLSLASLANEIQDLANIPVTDETGLPASYDFDLNCLESDLTSRNWDSISDAVGDLGLEIVLTNQPMRMLVVENTK